MRAVQRAYEDAGISSASVTLIEAHGTGTVVGDSAELTALTQVFAPHTDERQYVAVGSVKSMIGHTLSAAGTIEAAFSLMMLEQQRLLPTINYRKPDPAIPLDVVPNSARDAGLSCVMSNSFGFGGQNVSLIFGTAP